MLTADLGVDIIEIQAPEGAVGCHTWMTPGCRVVPVAPYRYTEPQLAFRHYPVSLCEVSQQAM